MTGPVTSPGLARFAPGEWRTFAAFLRHPALPERMTGIRLAAIGKVLQLFALDLVLMGLILGLIQLATALGFSIPENAIDNLKLTPLLLLLIIVVLPLAEEMAFRSWLSGRAGHIDAAAILIVGIAIPLMSGPQAHPVLLDGSLSIAALLAIGVAIWLRKRRAMPFFSRHFAWFYFASALTFAAIHLTNYTGGVSVGMLPLVVPQLLAGLIFGYARVTFGLWSDMLLHMMHNGLLVALIVLSKGM